MMQHWERLTRNSKILVATQMVRMLFGIYLVVKDWLIYDDVSSAITVLVIYVILGTFTTIFFYGKRFGLHGIVSLSVVLIIFNTIFTVLTLSSTIDAGLHNPSDNLWATILRYVFFLATLVFAIRVYRESRKTH